MEGGKGYIFGTPKNQYATFKNFFCIFMEWAYRPMYGTFTFFVFRIV